MSWILCCCGRYSTSTERSTQNAWLSGSLFARLGGLAMGDIHAKRELAVMGLRYNIIKMRRMDILSDTLSRSLPYNQRSLITEI